MNIDCCSIARSRVLYSSMIDWLNFSQCAGLPLLFSVRGLHRKLVSLQLGWYLCSQRDGGWDGRTCLSFSKAPKERSMAPQSSPLHHLVPEFGPSDMAATRLSCGSRAPDCHCRVCVARFTGCLLCMPRKRICDGVLDVSAVALLWILRLVISLLSIQVVISVALHCCSYSTRSTRCNYRDGMSKFLVSRRQTCQGRRIHNLSSTFVSGCSGL